MSLTLTTAANALKEFYIEGAREQLNNDTALLNVIEKNTRDVEGNYAVLSPHTSRNAGTGARPDGGTLPTAGNQGHANQRVPLVHNYASIEITGPTIRAMRTSRGSFVRAVKSEMTGAVNDLKRVTNRQAWGNSDAKIATCGTTTTSTTVVLATATTAVQMRQLEVGMHVDIGTVAAPTTIVANAVITAVSVANKTITIDSSVSTTSSHFVFQQGNAGVSVAYELEGQQKITDSTGTLHNVDPSTYPSWSSVELDNSGTLRPISENLMASAVMQVQIAGGEYPTYGFASDGVFRSYGNLLTAQKRYTGTNKLRGGYEGLDFIAGGPNVPITWDRDTPANSLYFLNLDVLFQYQSEDDWNWMDEDGAVLSRVAGKDAYGATLYKDHQQVTEKRNASGKVVDLIES